MINILTYLTDSPTRTKPCAHCIILDFKIKYIAADNLWNNGAISCGNVQVYRRFAA